MSSARDGVSSGDRTMPRIHVLVPVVSAPDTADPPLSISGDESLTLSWSAIEQGPTSIEGDLEEALAVPGLVEKAVQAERDGAHALVIDCMGDPGLAAIREVVEIPVLAPASTSMRVATILGRRFSVITVLRRLHPLVREHAARYGVSSHMAPPRSIAVPVLELHSSKEKVVSEFLEQAQLAIHEDEADTLILGCTGLYEVADELKIRIAAEVGTSVPVIEPLSVTIEVAASLVRLGLSHSKKGYPTPEPKEIVGYNLGGNG